MRRDQVPILPSMQLLERQFLENKARFEAQADLFKSQAIVFRHNMAEFKRLRELIRPLPMLKPISLPAED